MFSTLQVTAALPSHSVFVYFQYCLAFIALPVIATLRSPPVCSKSKFSLFCLLPCVLIPARVSWIKPLSRRSDSVYTSLGLLLMLSDYTSSQALWISFADHRPTLALGLLCVLPMSYFFAVVRPCLCL